MNCPFCGERFTSHYAAVPSFACCTLVPTNDDKSRTYQSVACIRGERDRLLLQLGQAEQEIRALRSANVELMSRVKAGGAL